MIYYLNGTLTLLKNDLAVVECGGVGYSAGISVSTASKLSGLLGKTVRLYTYLALREDNAELFGFYDEDELSLFKRLIAVSGIGPKGAISILGTHTSENLRAAIASGDAKTIAQAPGIGLKTAQKLIIELKGRIDMSELGIDASGPEGDKLSQVVDTLTLYGFARTQIISAVKRQDASLPLEQLINATLKTLGREGRL